MTKEQWTAIQNRDKEYDGVFFYGLKTTKHICRPSCPSRPRQADNIVIFDSLEDGLESGYTPCLRCHPELKDWQGSRQELADKAAKYIEEHFQEKFSSKKMANELFVNESYLHRAFKDAKKQTLLEYQNNLRIDKAKELLSRNELTISYICNHVGFVSHSHFSRTFKKICGCTPTQWRREYNHKLAFGNAV